MILMTQFTLLQENILTILIFIGILVTVALSALLIKFIVIKLSELEKNSDFILSTEFIEQAKKIVFDVVISINKSIVEDLKDKSQDGKLDSEEAKMLLENAVNEVMKIFSKDMLSAMELIIGDVRAWITKQIEIKVGELSIERKTRLKLEENSSNIK